ncbi:BON domain-containing protein [bacterium]|nr:BON domain-containing protein [bacterium]
MTTLAMSGLRTTRSLSRPRPHVLPVEQAADESAVVPGPNPDWLASRVQSALRETGYGGLHAVEVLVESGAVTLKGIVSCYYHKQVATSAVMPLDGVESLNNQLRVARLCQP